MKVRVCVWLCTVCTLYLLFCAAMWTAIFLTGGADTLNVPAWIILSAVTLCSIGMFIWCLFTAANIIWFGETGISRVRFGKVIRHFDWTDVKTFAEASGGKYGGWVYASDKQKAYDIGHITKMRLDRDVIYFFMTPKAYRAFTTYAPEQLKAQFSVSE